MKQTFYSKTLTSGLNQKPGFILLILLLICVCLPFTQADGQTYTEETPFLTPVDVKEMKSWLKNAPAELTAEAKSKAIIVDLPLPGGNAVSVRAVKSFIADTELYLRNPGIMTYAFQGLNNPVVSGRMTLSPKGLEVYMFTPEGDVYIEAETYGSELHKVYYVEAGNFPHKANDAIRPDGEQYEHKHTGDEPAHEHGKDDLSKMMATYMIGSNRRDFRMHVIADMEYSVAVCGANPTRNCVEMAIMTAVNALNALYIRDMAIMLTLTNNTTIYLSGNPAGFAAGNGSMDPDWIQESLDHHLFMESNTTGHNGGAGNDNMMVPRNSYDVGHLFSGRVGMGSGGGGVASLSSVCNDNPSGMSGPLKAGGGSGVPNPQGTGWVNLLAHEFTHQFNADHTWSGNTGFCTPDQWGPNASYEPGGGSTIVSYAMICAPQNVPNLGDVNYYHTISIKEVDDYIESAGVTCETNTASGNTPPVVSASTSNCTPSYNIPIRTPFEITGSATDANDPVGQLTYTWEQFDLAGARHDPITAPITKNANGGFYPLFRSFFPSGSASRTFPQLPTIISNNYNGDTQNAAALGLGNWQGELLPEVDGSINMRLTVRDNNATAGGVEHADAMINVVNTGPFKVNSPNGGGAPIAAGNMFNVTWDVAGTTAAPISCANVTIKVSIDGGMTYPYTLAVTANDGSEMVTMPANVPANSTSRIRIECGTDCFKFFDISNGNFIVASGCGADFSNICPTQEISAPQGDPSLNLNMSHFFGMPVTQHAFNLSAASLTGELANSTTMNGTTCQTNWQVESYETFDFAVSATGNYNFSEVGGATIAYSVFEAAGYNPATPCAGTFIGSNAWGAIQFNQNRTLALTACTTYKLVVWTVTNNFGVKTITFNGPGTVYAAGPGPGAVYGYTFVAVSTADDQIKAQNPTGNFTTLAAGSYKVYGASYKSSGPTPPANVSPANWINMTIAQVLAGGDCVVFSSNCRQMVITGGATCTPPVVNAPTVTQTTCATPTGTIVVNATSANTIEYSIDNGATYQASNTFSGLAPGNYNIVVRETANTNCSTTYANNPVVINAVPMAPVVNMPTVNQPTCATPTGTIVVNATGDGTLEYSVDNGTTWQTSSTFDNLAPGNYNIKVRLQADPTCMTAYNMNPVVLNAPTGCCPAVGSIIITEIMQNPNAVLDANGEWFEVFNTTGAAIDLNGWVIKDNGTDNHTINTSVSVPAMGFAVLGINSNMATNGGVNVDYQYTGITLANGDDEVVLECGGNTVIDAVVYDGGPSFPDPTGASMNLNPGQFNSVANDNGANWCEATTVFGAGDRGTPGAMNDACAGACTPPVVNAPTVTQPTCAVMTGTIVVNATSANTIEYSVDNGTTWQASNSFSGLAAGNYNIKVRETANTNCMTTYANNPVVINAVPTAPTVNAPTVTQPTCTITSGTIVVNATGAGTLEYSVDNGASWQASNTFSNLNPGNYNIKVRLQSDPSCMTAYANNPVVLNVPQNCCTPPVVNAPTVTQPTCVITTGTIVVNATGAGTLEYSVDNGASWQASNTFSNLNPGNYNIKVRLQSDPSCMTAYANNPVVLNVPQNCCTPPVVNAPTVTQPTCVIPTGTIVVNATGAGTLEYSVDNGASWQTSNTFSNLNPGNYNIKVRLQSDPSCMTAYANNPVVLNVPQNCCTLPTVNAPTVTQPNCTVPSGTIVVNATGANTLEYSVDNGASYQASNTFSNLVPGNYNIKVREVNNTACMTAYLNNPVVINAVPVPPTVNAPSVTQPTCLIPTGIIEVNATGNGILEYSIDNGTTWQLGEVFGTLQPGNYNIKVRLQVSPDCMTAYANNPVVMDAPPGSSNWYRDVDGDQFGDPNDVQVGCIAPAGYVADNTDCDDTRGNVNPNGVEVCDGLDNDCDGQIDEGALITFFRDVDGDNFGDPNDTQMGCAPQPGYVVAGGDCNDNDANINPGAAEVCDGIDNNCDGNIDEGVSTDYYQDSDNDGFGNPNVLQQACVAPAGFVTDNGDCDDTNNAIHPNATEVCDGVDNDCDGQIDEGLTTTFYQDSDNDGFGNPNAPQQACTMPAGFVANNNDCDDANNAVHPNAQESCDGIDNDCNGLIDDNDPGVTGQATWYTDGDTDGFGDNSTAVLACAQPAGTVNIGGDCNDNNNLIFPGAQELCNGVDDDCDGIVDNNIVTGITVTNISACNDQGTPTPADDTFTADVTVLYSTIPASGTLDLSGDGMAFENVANIAGTSHTFTEVTMIADGTAISLTATFSFGNCGFTNNNAGTAPPSCSNCDITALTVGNFGFCNSQNNADPSDDTFTADVTVTFINPPTTGTLDLSGDGMAFVAVGSLGPGMHTFVGVVLPADGGPISLTATFSDEQICTFTNGNAGTAPGPCCFVGISAINVTPETCAGAGNGTITIMAIGTGQLQYSIDGGATYNLTGFFESLTPGNYNILVRVLGSPTCTVTGMATVAGGGQTRTWYKDWDDDDYSDGLTLQSCNQPNGYKLPGNLAGLNNDCNDYDANEFPGQTWYKDWDDDGYSDGTTQTACLRPVGYEAGVLLVATSGDCNDNVASINPGAMEVCNGVDDDCDGMIDEGITGLTYVGNVTFNSQTDVDAWPVCYDKIQGNVMIQNSSVNNLTPLMNITEITGYLTVKNTSLSNMGGLNSLHTVGGNTIVKQNMSLTSLDGMESLASVLGNLQVFFNFVLTDCCAIHDLIDNGGVGGTISIFRNDTGCDNIAQIGAACNGNNNLAEPDPGVYQADPGGLYELRELALIPNPADEFVTVNVTGNYQLGIMKVFDWKGQVVHQRRLNAESGNYYLETSSWNQGIYLVNIQLDGEMLTKKLVVR